ncbi:helix-turn-helix domain-containing protein [Thalassiella azotivora]
MNALSEARQERGWSQTAFARRLQLLAETSGTPIAGLPSLKTQLSRWENGRVQPDPMYRRLIRELTGLTDDALGFTTESAPRPMVSALDERLAAARALTEPLIDSLTVQLTALREQDRITGSAGTLVQARALLERCEELLHFSTAAGMRRKIAKIAADVGALVGWQSLDVGDHGAAWRALEAAAAAAREADESALLAHALGEQCFALLDLGRPGEAVELARFARGQRALPAQVTAWLYATEAEAHAARGLTRETVHALTNAERRLTRAGCTEETPYIKLDAGQLRRWTGHCLVLADDRQAESVVLEGLNAVAGSGGRAETGALVDLAVAMMRRGAPNEAHGVLSQAESLSRRVGSIRQHRRIEAVRSAA